MYETDSIWWYNHPRHPATEKYDNREKGWCFQCGDDTKKSYEHNLSITYI